jgi:uncharacterized protein YneF (UPF0154 family)
MTALYILLALLVGVILGGTLTHVAIAWKITEQNEKNRPIVDSIIKDLDNITNDLKAN